MTQSRGTSSSTAEGSVEGEDEIGGFVGDNRGTIEACGDDT